MVDQHLGNEQVTSPGCSTLQALPPPASKESGWPWTQASSQLPELRAGEVWPRISIVTPSFNQAQYIEETIRSVLLQGYPNLEYIIIDGGSTDGTVDILRKYDPWLTYWVSEPDQGQAHALNKGLDRCSGDLFGWINSDDILLPSAVYALAQAFKEHPNAVLIGDVVNYHENFGFRQLIQPKDVTFRRIVEPWHSDVYWHQPGIYVPLALQRKIGPIDESLHSAFDFDWLCRLLRLAQVYRLPKPIAQFRFHSFSKTVAQASRWLEERLIVTKRYWDEIPGLDKKFAEATLHRDIAAIYLRLSSWNRQQGIFHMREAVKYDPRITLSRQFISLAARALMPVGLLSAARVFAIRWRKISQPSLTEMGKT